MSVDAATAARHAEWVRRRVEEGEFAPFVPVYASEGFESASGVAGRFYAQDPGGEIWEITLRPVGPARPS